MCGCQGRPACVAVRGGLHVWLSVGEGEGERVHVWMSCTVNGLHVVGLMCRSLLSAA